MLPESGVPPAVMLARAWFSVAHCDVTAPQAPESVKKWVAFGASVRAAQYLVLGGKSRALCAGRYHVSFEDIRAMAHPVMRHRVLTNFRAESEGVNTDTIIDELLERVPVPASGM